MSMGLKKQALEPNAEPLQLFDHVAGRGPRRDD